VPIEPDLREQVRALLSGYLGGHPLPADLTAEPLAIRAGTAVVYVRLVDAAPVVLRVFSPLLRHVARSAELVGELNDLNARLNFVRVFWRDDTVYASCELLAETLDPAELAHACDNVADTADYYDVRLHARFGGEVAFTDRRG